MMYICSMFLSCLCNCALFVCSSHVEEIKNIIIKNIIIIIISFLLVILPMANYHFFSKPKILGQGFSTCFATASRYITDFKTRNKLLTQKLLKQGYRYHKLPKTFSKFYRRYYDLISKFQVGLNFLLCQGLSEPEL